MGGKGGGGGGGAQSLEAQGYVLDPSKFGPADNPASAGYVTQADYDAKYPKAETPAAAAPAAAPAAAEPEPAAAPAAVALTGDPGPPKNDTLAPSIGGGATETADPAAPGGTGSAVTAGDTLGGSVLNPPKYWTGNASNRTGPTSRTGHGSMTTTQT